MQLPHPIECPSGLSLEIRGLKAKEANILADASQARRGQTFDQILAGCWLSTRSAGVYTPRPNGSLEWGKVLVCDRFYTIVQIRVATWGEHYSFPVQCREQMCRHKFDWSLNLNSDLVYKVLPEESRRIFQESNRFEVIIPSLGRKVVFSLQNGAMEVKAGQDARVRKDKAMTVSLAHRIVEIEGVAALDKLRFIDELDLGDAQAIMDALDDADGGLETQVEVECQMCGAQQEVELPLGREFWLPSKRPKVEQPTGIA